ncbi:MAG TPA: type II secretion system F family protein [Vicinamibacterales bacterium]
MSLMVAATFALVVAVVVAAYWLFVVRLESQEKSSVIKRLKASRLQTTSANVALAPEQLSSIPFLNLFLSRRRHVINPVQQLMVEAGLKYTAGAFLLASLVVGAAAAVFVWMMFKVIAVSVIAGVAAAFLPLFYVRYKRTKRLQTFEEQFPEAIDLIARALRAGHALTTGLGMVADEIPAPVGEEFKRLYDEQNFGMSLPEAMRAMARRVPVLDARFFVTAVLTQREAGGNLSEVLDNLASVMRERFKMKRQVRVASAHGRLSAWILALMAPGLAAILFTLSPNFMRVLFEDPWGMQLLLIAGTLQLIGTVIISRLVRIEY